MKLGQELHIPIPEVFLTLEVFDKDGKLVQKLHQRSHSWVRNAYTHLYCMMASANAPDPTYGAGYLNIKRFTDGLIFAVARSPGWTNANVETIGNMGFCSGAGDTTFGIVVGTSSQAESFDDWQLISKIANGTGASQLTYQAHEAIVKSYESGTKTQKVEHKRYFNNNSGGTISVNEVGIVGRMWFNMDSNRYALHSRDVLASTINIPNTGQLKVTYTIQLTYPA